MLAPWCGKVWHLLAAVVSSIRRDAAGSYACYSAGPRSGNRFTRFAGCTHLSIAALCRIAAHPQQQQRKGGRYGTHATHNRP